MCADHVCIDVEKFPPTLSLKFHQETLIDELHLPFENSFNRS